MAKTEVYSWRVASEVKEALEEASRQRGVSMASIIDDAVAEYLARPQTAIEADEAERQRFWESVRPLLGTIDGGDPNRSSQVRQRVRQRLREKHLRRRAPNAG